MIDYLREDQQLVYSNPTSFKTGFPLSREWAEETVPTCFHGLLYQLVAIVLRLVGAFRWDTQVRGLVVV